MKMRDMDTTPRSERLRTAAHALDEQILFELWNIATSYHVDQAKLLEAYVRQFGGIGERDDDSGLEDEA